MAASMIFAMAWAALAAAAAPAAEPADLLCTVEAARNESTGQIEPPGAPFFHPRDTLRAEGDTYLRSESRTDEHGETDAEHRIDRRTGAFETVAMRTVHEVGEQYMVRMTGTCRPAAHSPLARPSRY